MLEAMVIPKRIVMRFARAFCAVLDRLSSFRHSLRRFPNISIPTRDTDAGATSPAIIVTIIGNNILVSLVTDWGL